MTLHPALPARRSGGYTLIELMVVIVILGMVAGTVMVSWEAIIPNQRLNSDVRALAARIQGTRTDAIARGRPFRMHFDLENDRYWIETPFKKGGGFAGPEDERLIVEETNLKEGVEFIELVIEEESFADEIAHIRFDPLGASNNAMIVLYQAKFDRYFTIEILGLTGLVKFHDGIVERPEVSDSDFD